MLAAAPGVLVGSPRPRLGPPAPLRHDLAAYREVAASLDITPMPWQEVAATYATALGPADLWLYRELAVIVARQNGKTTFTKPLIIQRLRAGRRIMHIAQLRELPRVMFEAIADAIEADAPELLPRRRGKVIWPRRGAGSESIVLANGGEYRIASALKGGRGFSFDDLVIDELREMDTFDVVNAAKPAQRFSENPQTIYLSNAGTDSSVILNSLRRRAGAEDPSLAYLEWSADPEYDAADRRGWIQADPAIGHYPQVLRDLEQDYVAAKLAGNMAGFETEALCRWVPSMRPRLVDEFGWMRGRTLKVAKPRRPSFGISLDPDGTRASVVMAWRQDDRTIALQEMFDVKVNEDGLDDLGAEAMRTARKMGAGSVGYDDRTDRAFARHFKTRAKSIIGKDFDQATVAFVQAIERNEIRWVEGSHITADLTMTSRKDNDETGTYHAVKSKDDVPITAALAAIRAFWLASSVIQTGSLQVK